MESMKVTRLIPKHGFITRDERVRRFELAENVVIDELPAKMHNGSDE